MADDDARGEDLHCGKQTSQNTVSADGEQQTDTRHSSDLGGGRTALVNGDVTQVNRAAAAVAAAVSRSSAAARQRLNPDKVHDSGAHRYQTSYLSTPDEWDGGGGGGDRSAFHFNFAPPVNPSAVSSSVGDFHDRLNLLMPACAMVRAAAEDDGEEEEAAAGIDAVINAAVHFGDFSSEDGSVEGEVAGRQTLLCADVAAAFTRLSDRDRAQDDRPRPAASGGSRDDESSSSSSNQRCDKKSDQHADLGAEGDAPRSFFGSALASSTSCGDSSGRNAAERSAQTPPAAGISLVCLSTRLGESPELLSSLTSQPHQPSAPFAQKELTKLQHVGAAVTPGVPGGNDSLFSPPVGMFCSNFGGGGDSGTLRTIASGRDSAAITSGSFLPQGDPPLPQPPAAYLLSPTQQQQPAAILERYPPRPVSGTSSTASTNPPNKALFSPHGQSLPASSLTSPPVPALPALAFSHQERFRAQLQQPHSLWQPDVRVPSRNNSSSGNGQGGSDGVVVAAAAASLRPGEPSSCRCASSAPTAPISQPSASRGTPAATSTTSSTTATVTPVAASANASTAVTARATAVNSLLSSPSGQQFSSYQMPDVTKVVEQQQQDVHPNLFLYSPPQAYMGSAVAAAATPNASVSSLSSPSQSHQPPATTQQQQQQAERTVAGCTLTPSLSVSAAVDAAATSIQSRRASRNLYFRNLPRSWNTSVLRDLCSGYGAVLSAKVAHHPVTNESLGYGFVLFEHTQSAAMCVAALNHALIHAEGETARRLLVRMAHPSAAPTFQEDPEEEPARAGGEGNNMNHNYNNSSSGSGTLDSHSILCSPPQTSPVVLFTSPPAGPTIDRGSVRATSANSSVTPLTGARVRSPVFATADAVTQSGSVLNSPGSVSAQPLSPMSAIGSRESSALFAAEMLQPLPLVLSSPSSQRPQRAMSASGATVLRGAVASRLTLSPKAEASSLPPPLPPSTPPTCTVLEQSKSSAATPTTATTTTTTAPAVNLTAATSACNVYIANLPPTWSAVKLRELCSAFGPIVSASVARYRKTNESRGYGFVLFTEARDAAACLRALHQYHVPHTSHVLTCRLAKAEATPSITYFTLSPNEGDPLRCNRRAVMPEKRGESDVLSADPQSGSLHPTDAPSHIDVTHHDGNSSNDGAQKASASSARMRDAVFMPVEVFSTLQERVLAQGVQYLLQQQQQEQEQKKAAGGNQDSPKRQTGPLTELSGGGAGRSARGDTKAVLSRTQQSELETMMRQCVVYGCNVPRHGCGCVRPAEAATLGRHRSPHRCTTSRTQSPKQALEEELHRSNSSATGGALSSRLRLSTESVGADSASGEAVGATAGTNSCGRSGESSVSAAALTTPTAPSGAAAAAAMVVGTYAIPVSQRYSRFPLTSISPLDAAAISTSTTATAAGGAAQGKRDDSASASSCDNASSEAVGISRHSSGATLPLGGTVGSTSVMAERWYTCTLFTSATAADHFLRKVLSDPLATAAQDEVAATTTTPIDTAGQSLTADVGLTDAGAAHCKMHFGLRDQVMVFSGAPTSGTDGSRTAPQYNVHTTSVDGKASACTPFRQEQQGTQDASPPPPYLPVRTSGSTSGGNINPNSHEIHIGRGNDIGGCGGGGARYSCGAPIFHVTSAATASASSNAVGSGFHSYPSIMADVSASSWPPSHGHATPSRQCVAATTAVPFSHFFVPPVSDGLLPSPSRQMVSVAPLPATTAATQDAPSPLQYAPAPAPSQGIVNNVHVIGAGANSAQGATVFTTYSLHSPPSPANLMMLYAPADQQLSGSMASSTAAAPNVCGRALLPSTAGCADGVPMVTLPTFPSFSRGALHGVPVAGPAAVVGPSSASGALYGVCPTPYLSVMDQNAYREAMPAPGFPYTMAAPAGVAAAGGVQYDGGLPVAVFQGGANEYPQVSNAALYP